MPKAVGLVRGDKLSVDGTFVEANASKESRVPREQLAEVAQVNRTVREYLAELASQNPEEEPTHNSVIRCPQTDPDSTLCDQGRHCLPSWAITTIIWSIITAASLWAYRLAGARLRPKNLEPAQEMIACFAQWQGRKPQSIAADASYGNGEFLQWLMDRDIAPYMPTRDTVGRTRSPFYGPERFTYQPESNSYIFAPSRPATELWEAVTRATAHLRLYRNAQEVRPLPTEVAVHDGTVPVSRYPHE